jgi:hypothetical protein
MKCISYYIKKNNNNNETIDQNTILNISDTIFSASLNGNNITFNIIKSGGTKVIPWHPRGVGG